MKACRSPEPGDTFTLTFKVGNIDASFVDARADGLASNNVFELSDFASGKIPLAPRPIQVGDEVKYGNSIVEVLSIHRDWAWAIVKGSKSQPFSIRVENLDKQGTC